MEKIRTIIIDDEKNGREVLQALVEKNLPEVEIIATAASAAKGAAAILKHKPDLIFLDVEMPNGTGFSMLKDPKLGELSFQIIFTTAYEEYAIQAIKVDAIDYLLKPIDRAELIEAIKRVKNQRKDSKLTVAQISKLLKINFPTSNKLKLVTREGFDVLNIADVIYCKSEGNYTGFILVDGSYRLVSKTLKVYQEVLETNGFLRIHKSHIVNLNKIERYLNRKKGAVVMSNGDVLEISKERKEAFMKAFSL